MLLFLLKGPKFPSTGGSERPVNHVVQAIIIINQQCSTSVTSILNYYKPTLTMIQPASTNHYDYQPIQTMVDLHHQCEIPIITIN